MKKICLLLSLLLCLSLFTGCKQTPELPEGVETVKIAYIPIDDRPDNLERPVYLAQSLGYELCMPERDLYATKLNGQPLNSNGTQSGDRAALYEWLVGMEEGGCDRYIIALDQLLSGGLVNSRAMFGSESVTLSDGTVLTETELLQKTVELLSSDENNRVWLLDSVMRLAPTVGYSHWDAEDYENLRSYASLPRPAADTPETITESYRLDENGAETALSDYSLSESDVAEYLAARERKLLLSDELLRLTADCEDFRVLIGIDDSSDQFSIQYNEICYLSSRLRSCDYLISGVDDLAFKSIARLYLDDIGWQGCEVNVQYYGGMEDSPACIYDYRTLSEIVSEHMDFFGLTQSEAAPLEVLVLTQPEDYDKRSGYFDALLDRLNTNEKNGVLTVLIEASDSRYGLEFQNLLLKKASLGSLISYSGALDMAIVTGTALSHGVARYAYLLNGTESEATNAAFKRSLADSVIKDMCYRNEARVLVTQYVNEKLGGNHNNLYTPEVDIQAAEKKLAALMDEYSSPVIRNLEGSRFIGCLSENGIRKFGKLTLSDYAFPWNRTFEISMTINFE